MEPSPQNPPEQPAVVVTKEVWHAPLNRVTTLSKITAAIVFITLPFVGFWVGMQYGQDVNEPTVSEVVDEIKTQGQASITHQIEPSATKESEQLTPSVTSMYPVISESGGVVLVDLGEYLVRYKKVSPNEEADLEVLERQTNIVTARLPWRNQTYADGPEIMVVDANFDGILDIGLVDSTGRGGGVTSSNYTFYTYDKQQAVLKDFAGLTDPIFDPQTKTISESFYDFAYEAGVPNTDKRIELIKTHQYKDGVLIWDEKGVTREVN
jgi:hypothetical protein